MSTSQQFRMLRPQLTFVMAIGLLSVGSVRGDEAESAISKAITYLSAEVPRWPRENHCYSCHNNGDGARALFTALRLGREINDEALADATSWLTRPDEWKNNRGDPAFSDKALADLQFAAALASAAKADKSPDRDSVRAAASLVASHQQEDGGWKIDGPDTLGGPVTWGPPLLTAMAADALLQTDPNAHQAAIQRARRWLQAVPVRSNLNAGALLIGLANDSSAAEPCRQCVEQLRQGEAGGGGWGPYSQTPPEPFDTAVALLGLCRLSKKEQDQHRGLIDRGRKFLIESQHKDGSWPETTRPALAISYAQRVSTTAWALEALLESER